MSEEHQLRVLIANERAERLELLAHVVEGLGHEVVARSVSTADVAAQTARERPDVAIVGLGSDSEHALVLISEITREAYCPVIAILSAFDHRWVNEAAERGVYAYIVEGDPEELQSTIDITLRRFADVQSLQSAVERRASETSKLLKSTSERQRHALELHDNVVQGLVTAQMSYDLGHNKAGGEALQVTLDHAKAVVTRSLLELQAEGLDAAQLIRDSTAQTTDE